MFLCRDCATTHYYIEFPNHDPRRVTKPDFDGRGKSQGPCEQCGEVKLCVDFGNVFHENSEHAKKLSQGTQVLRRLTRDKVISVTHKDLVGVYFEDTDGSEVLIECGPDNADKIIAVWNEVVEDEFFSTVMPLKP